MARAKADPCGMTNKRTGKNNHRSFDCGAHNGAVSASVQDDSFRGEKRRKF